MVVPPDDIKGPNHNWNDFTDNDHDPLLFRTIPRECEPGEERSPHADFQCQFVIISEAIKLLRQLVLLGGCTTNNNKLNNNNAPPAAPHLKGNNDDIALIQCALGELTSSSALENTAFPTLLRNVITITLHLRVVTNELDSTSTELQLERNQLNMMCDCVRHLKRAVKILYDENKSLKKKETTRSRLVNQLLRELENAEAKEKENEEKKLVLKMALHERALRQLEEDKCEVMMDENNNGDNENATVVSSLSTVSSSVTDEGLSTVRLAECGSIVRGGGGSGGRYGAAGADNDSLSPTSSLYSLMKELILDGRPLLPKVTDTNQIKDEVRVELEAKTEVIVITRD